MNYVSMKNDQGLHDYRTCYRIKSPFRRYNIEQMPNICDNFFALLIRSVGDVETFDVSQHQHTLSTLLLLTIQSKLRRRTRKYRDLDNRKVKVMTFES